MDEPLAILLLPCRLEEFELAAHASDLLAIPRVVAVEPRRKGKDRPVGDAAAVRQARRLRFPGQPQVFVLFHPFQYPLARALCARYRDAELWYLRPVGERLQAVAESEELETLDALAGQRATHVLAPQPGEDARTDNQPLRRRLVELEIISTRPFVPGARIGR